MSEVVDFDTKVSAEGRVVIPAAVREALGLHAGDRLRFILEDGEVRLVTARSLLSEVWANNAGEGSGDSAREVRAERTSDQRHVAAKWERVDKRTAADTRSEAEISASLLAGLGLAQAP